MRIALYIEDGLEQIVLTPQTDAEKRIVGKLHDGDRELTVHRGGFYHCQGGWLRESGEQDSTMLVLRRPRADGNYIINAGKLAQEDEH